MIDHDIGATSAYLYPMIEGPLQRAALARTRRTE